MAVVTPGSVLALARDLLPGWLACFFFSCGYNMLRVCFSLEVIRRMCGDPCTGAHAREENAAAAVVIGYTTSAHHLCAFVSTSFLVAWSDVIGRKPVLLLGAAAFALGTGGCALAAAFELPLWVLQLSFALAGLCGGSPTFHATIFALTADASHSAARASSFSLLEGLVFLGGAVGPLLTGPMLESSLPVAAAFGCIALAFVLALLALAALRPADAADARSAPPSARSCWAAARNALRLLLGRRKGAGPRPTGVALWLAVFALGYTPHLEAMTLLPNLLKLSRYFGSAGEPARRFSDDEIGGLVSLEHGAKAASLLVLLPALVACSNSRPRATAVRAVRAGCLAACVSVALFGALRWVPAVFAAAALEGAEPNPLPSPKRNAPAPPSRVRPSVSPRRCPRPQASMPWSFLRRAASSRGPSSAATAPPPIAPTAAVTREAPSRCSTRRSARRSWWRQSRR